MQTPMSSRKKKKISLKLSTFILTKRGIMLLNVPIKKIQKLVSVLITSTLIIIARKKVSVDIKIDENGENSKNGNKYLTNLV